MLASTELNIYAARTSSFTKDVPKPCIDHIRKSMDTFLDEVRDLFAGPLGAGNLDRISCLLQEEYQQKLQASDISMLPSYLHTLPSGSECGTFLALDQGGSNFRLALVELRGKQSKQAGMRVKRTTTFPIDETVRRLQGRAFFDWMAARIEEMLEADHHEADGRSEPLPMGLAWSFPIEQTSTRSGFLLTMGKGFAANIGVQGQDLNDLIMTACRKRRLNVDLRTVVNDASATLVSQAYCDQSTRMSLILGTGTNAGVFLPVSAMSPNKYGKRSQKWYDAAKHVLVNTELSMHGGSVWPASRWDDALNKAHSMPDFQPLEHRVGGRYLGEIVRLILVEAIIKTDLFDNKTPHRLHEAYALETGTLAAFESGPLSHASKVFYSAHPAHRKPTTAELDFIRSICQLVTRRAAALIAVAMHALWALRLKAEKETPTDWQHMSIACNGSVLEKYPSFRAQCQGFLDDLMEKSGARAGSVTLEMAPDSSIFGAAVAAACVQE